MKEFLTFLSVLIICSASAQKNEDKTILTKLVNNEWISTFKKTKSTAKKIALIKEKIIYDSKFEFESFLEFAKINSDKMVLDSNSYHKKIEEYNKKYPAKKIQFVLTARNKSKNLDIRKSENIKLLLNALDEENVSEIAFLELSDSNVNYDETMSDLVIVKSKNKELKHMIKTLL